MLLVDHTVTSAGVAEHPPDGWCEIPERVVPRFVIRRCGKRHIEAIAEHGVKDGGDGTSLRK